MKRDRLVMSVVLNGVELPLDLMVVVRLLIVSHYRQSIPTAELIVIDTPGVFKRHVSLSDGIQAAITIGTDERSAKTYNFRVFKHQLVNSPSGPSYRILFYLDKPAYWGGTTTKSFKGTSSAALQYIAETNGMSAVVNSTNDSMVWLPMNDRWCKWAARISSAAYSDEKSGFLLGVKLDGTLVFRNVAAYLYGDKMPLFTNVPAANADILLPLLNHKHVTTSGFNNMSGGYHASTLSQTVMADAGQVFDQVTKVRATHQMSMNMDVKGLLAEARKLSVSPVECGNTHPSYHKAVYQNKRLAQVCSNHLAVLTNVVSPLDLLDPCETKIFQPPVAGQSDVDYDNSGYYFVTSKSIYVGPDATYVERYALARDGHGIDPQRTGKDV